MNKPYKKVFSPLFFDLVNNRLVPSNDFEDELSLMPGFMNGNENYGFFIIAKKDGKFYCQNYGTEERIQAAGVEGDYFFVYEEGKYASWVFRMDGTLVEEAKFNSRFRSDQEYYESHYEGLPQENTYRSLR